MIWLLSRDTDKIKFQELNYSAFVEGTGWNIIGGYYNTRLFLKFGFCGNRLWGWELYVEVLLWDALGRESEGKPGVLQWKTWQIPL